MIWLTLLLACANEQASWQLIGAYDASALRRLQPDGDPNFVWTPAAGMVESCGPAKGPAGMGIFEAESVSSALSPTLALVLRNTNPAAAPALGPHNVRVSLGGEVLMQPMVTPRHIAVRLKFRPEDERYAELVRTQVEMETCLEHKLGRGWLGGETRRVEQAFLLRKPDSANRADRGYFGGQRDPVPALLGAPDACLLGSRPATPDGGKGEGSLDLVPSDIWGASLRPCGFKKDEIDKLETEGRLEVKSSEVPLAMSMEPAAEGASLAQDAAQQAKVSRYWELLDIELREGLNAKGQPEMQLALSYGGRSQPPEALLPEDEKGVAGLVDTLAKVPYTYPNIGPEGDSRRYTVLLVPNWQVVEGLRRLDAKLFKESMRDAPSGPMNGVAWVLANPDLLSVQVIPSTRRFERAGTGEFTEISRDGNTFTVSSGRLGITLSQKTDKRERDELVKAELERLEQDLLRQGYQKVELQQRDLADPMGGGSLGLLDWGYTMGFAAGRNAMVLPADEEPTWDQVSAAHRARQHTLFLVSVAISGLVVFAGLRRLPELWTPVPEERADYWPGKAQADETDLAKQIKVEGAGGGGGGEK